MGCRGKEEKTTISHFLLNLLIKGSCYNSSKNTCKSQVLIKQPQGRHQGRTEHDSPIWRGVWKKAPLGDSWSHVKFTSSVQGSGKQFATKNLALYQMPLRVFFHTPLHLQDKFCVVPIVNILPKVDSTSDYMSECLYCTMDIILVHGRVIPEHQIHWYLLNWSSPLIHVV